MNLWKLFIKTIIICFLSSISIKLQSNEASSEEIEKNRVEHLLAESSKVAKTNLDSALQLAYQALSLDLNNQDSLKKRLLNHTAYLFLHMGKLDSAESYFSRHFECCSKFRDSLCMATNWLGMAMVYRMRGQHTEALRLGVAAIPYFEQAKDSSKLGRVYNTLGNIYSIQAKWGKAIAHYQEGLAVLSHQADTATTTQLLYNMGISYYELNQLTKADSVFQLSLEGAKELNHLIMQANVYHSLGIIAWDQGDLVKAKNYYSKARALQEQMGDWEGEVYTLMSLGELAEESEQLVKAENHYQEALTLAVELGIKEEELMARELLIFAYQAQGKLLEANEQWERYNNLKDTLNEATTGERILELQEKYETEKKEKENLLLEKENQQKEKELMAKDQILYNQTLALVIVAVVVILLIILLSNYRKRIKAEKQLRRQQLYLSRKKMMDKVREQELAYVNATLVGQESERKRIAADLHDGLSNMMVTVKLYFENLADQITHEHEEVKRKYAEAVSLLDDLCGKARNLAHDLSSQSSSFTLKPALKEMVNIINQTGKLKVELSMYGIEEAYGVNFENTVFHVLRELIGNALKHADANTLFIQLTQHSESLNILVEDDGKGYDVEKTHENGLGLNHLQERIEKLKGKLQIESTLGRGTSVSIELPIINQLLNQTPYA